MKTPRQTPVMTLPNATLFPRAFLPLYIFEPRYRQMLTDALHTNRMFAVAMQQPGSARETPSPVAGLGVIRASVGHRDGTSHLILQGLARVELKEIIRQRPYRVHQIKPLPTPPCDSVAVDALMAKMRELLEERMKLGLPFPPAAIPRAESEAETPPSSVSSAEIMEYLDSLTDPAQAADMVSYHVLPGATERQAILETIDVETRLRRLIQFLLAEIRDQGNGG